MLEIIYGSCTNATCSTIHAIQWKSAETRSIEEQCNGGPVATTALGADVSAKPGKIHSDDFTGNQHKKTSNYW